MSQRNDEYNAIREAHAGIVKDLCDALFDHMLLDKIPQAKAEASFSKGLEVARQSRDIALLLCGTGDPFQSEGQPKLNRT